MPNLTKIANNALTLCCSTMLALVIVASFAMFVSVTKATPSLGPYSVPMCGFLFVWSLAACWSSMQK
jgi:hypothetical protein